VINFEETLCNLIHYSSTLLHLDISEMSLSFNQLLTIASKGLMKARTLHAVHMSGLGLNSE